MTERIYADNAATTRIDPEALQAMNPWLDEAYGNPSARYDFARRSRNAVNRAREEIATCIHAEPDEIYFTSGGSESDNWAIKSCMIEQFAHKTVHEAPPCIITSAFEHHAVLNTCHALSQFGCQTHELPISPIGVVSPDALKQSLTQIKNVGLCSIMLANNEIGTFQPIAQLAQQAHEHGITFHTDAVQAVGHIPVDVQSLGVDMLSASAHKFNGPRGIGFLYIKRGTPIQPLIHGGAQERGLRAGTENVAAIVGMATALRNAVHDMVANTIRLQNMTDCILSGLRHARADFVLNGDAPRIPGVLSLSFYNADGEAMLHQLDLMGIDVATGSACDSHEQQISHVIRALGVPVDYARGTLRISFGRYNAESDGEAIVHALTRVLNREQYHPVLFPE